MTDDSNKKYDKYRPRSEGDNVLGRFRLSVCLFVRLFDRLCALIISLSCPVELSSECQTIKPMCLSVCL